MAGDRGEREKPKEVKPSLEVYQQAEAAARAYEQQSKALEESLRRREISPKDAVNMALADFLDLIEYINRMF